MRIVHDSRWRLALGGVCFLLFAVAATGVNYHLSQQTSKEAGREVAANLRKSCEAANHSTRPNIRFILRLVEGLAATSTAQTQERLAKLKPRIDKRVSDQHNVNCDTRFPNP